MILLSAVFGSGVLLGLWIGLACGYKLLMNLASFLNRIANHLERTSSKEGPK